MSEDLQYEDLPAEYPEFVCLTDGYDILKSLGLCICCLRPNPNFLISHGGRFWLCDTCDSDVSCPSDNFDPVCRHYEGKLEPPTPPPTPVQATSPPVEDRPVRRLRFVGDSEVIP